MKLNQSTLKALLDEDYKIAENEIESQFRFYANFDKNISDWLSAMHHFGGYGEFYEMVALLTRGYLINIFTAISKATHRQMFK